MVIRIFGLRGYVSRSSESSYAMHKKEKKNLLVGIPTIGIVEEMMFMGFYRCLQSYPFGENLVPRGK